MKLSFLPFLIIGTSHLFVDAMHGGDIGKIQQVPYMAELYKKFEGGFFGACGATILSDRWILTAAHCVKRIGQDSLTSQRVRVKAHTPSGKDGIYHNISKTILHRKFSADDNRWNSDIALIELVEPIKLDEKSQIIPISKKSPKIGDVVTVSGYGDDYNVYGEALKLGQQSVISRRACREAYKKAPQAKFAIDSRVFCTDSSTLDLCYGDSGSPGVMNGKVVGVAVEGCESPLPNVYVSVANYYDWIVGVTGIKFD